MALKKPNKEVRHVIVSGPLDELNVNVANILNDGWEIIECRMINADYFNQIYTIFYVLYRNLE